jgi:hypothetical protein
MLPRTHRRLGRDHPPNTNRGRNRLGCDRFLFTVGVLRNIASAEMLCKRDDSTRQAVDYEFALKKKLVSFRKLIHGVRHGGSLGASRPFRGFASGNCNARTDTSRADCPLAKSVGARGGIR